MFSVCTPLKRTVCPFYSCSIQVLLGVLVITSNSYLIACFAKIEDVRSVSNYPLFLQSVLDLVFIGLTCMISGIFKTVFWFGKRTEEANNFTYSPLEGVSLCLCIFEYTLINQCTTPLTMLALTVQRFYQVCRPIDGKSEEFLKRQSMAFVLLTAVASAIFSGELVFILIKVMPEVHGTQFNLSNFDTCEYVIFSTPKIRSIISGIVLFLLPALCCSVLYTKVATDLRKMISQREPNKQLTIPFMVSCILWVVFWLPEKLFNLLDSPFAYLGILGKFYSVFHLTYLYITLLFSAIQPLFIILLYRPISEKLREEISNCKERLSQCCRNWHYNLFWFPFFII